MNRLAFVIGNSNYSNVNKLNNPINDAIPFKHLMNGQYQPPLPGKTLQRYYIDLRELNAMFHG